LRGGARGGVEYLWSTRADSDGIHLWQARAWDQAGNVGMSMSLLVRVKNNPDPPPADHQPPVVNWLSPQAGDTVQGLVELRFQALDNIRLASVVVYVNGAVLERQILNASFFDGNVVWVTNSFADGNYIIEVRAWDNSGNVGIGVGVTLRVWNNRPRVIWVPDDYNRIQDAIWHSENGDTIMVRNGQYHEQLQFFYKNISLMTESGPDSTVINGTGFYATVAIGGGQDTSTVIRGFSIIGGELCISIGGGTSPKIVNNILLNGTRTGILSGVTYALIANNLIMNFRYGVELSADWSYFINNITAVQNKFWTLNRSLIIKDLGQGFTYIQNVVGL